MRYAVLFNMRRDLSIHARDCRVATAVVLAPGKSYGTDRRRGIVRTDVELDAPTQAAYDAARGDDTGPRGYTWKVCPCTKGAR